VSTPRASDHHGAGCQPTGSAKPFPPPGRAESFGVSPKEHGTLHPAPPRIQSHAHAAETLDDTRYLVYCLVNAAKHFISLMCKRWPEFK